MKKPRLPDMRDFLRDTMSSDMSGTKRYLLFLDVSSVAIGKAVISDGRIHGIGSIKIEGRRLSSRLCRIRMAIQGFFNHLPGTDTHKCLGVVIEEPFCGQKQGKTNSDTIRACVGAWGSAVSSVPAGIPIFMVAVSSWHSVVSNGSMPRGCDRKANAHSYFFVKYPAFKSWYDSGQITEDGLDAACIASAVLSSPEIAKVV